jgi:hypothetical protein
MSSTQSANFALSIDTRMGKNKPGVLQKRAWFEEYSAASPCFPISANLEAIQFFHLVIVLFALGAGINFQFASGRY